MFASARTLQYLAVRTSARTWSTLQCRAMATATPPSFQLLSYKYVSDILEKRGPYREAHLAGARQKGEDGKLILAGAVGKPVDGGLFVWRDTPPEEIKAFVEADPYFKAGLISSWSVSPYNVVVNAMEK